MIAPQKIYWRIVLNEVSVCDRLSDTSERGNAPSGLHSRAVYGCGKPFANIGIIDCFEATDQFWPTIGRGDQ
ncbi:hypothetical protein CDZ96_25910 [Mameliella alba]|nr:hypothetical protein CDZ96_25910 [Mameliella alba]